MTWAIPRAHLTAATEAWDRWRQRTALADRQAATLASARQPAQVDAAARETVRDVAIVATALIVILLAVLGMVVQWSVDGLRTPTTPTVATLSK
jgi:hypothetical protein